MNRSALPVCCLGMIAALSMPTDTLADEIADALTNGKFSIQARLRDESVDDSVNSDAHALTLRTKLGYTSAPFRGFSIAGEISDTRVALGQGDYAPNTGGYAVIADPEITEVNLAYVSYTSESGFTFKGGRQRIILDNARFVGNVGWRQKEQTFDAFSFGFSPLDKVEVSYAFVDRVKGITTAFNADVTDHLLNAKWDGGEVGTVSVYAYLLEEDITGVGSDTVGIRYAKNVQTEPATISFVLEYADHGTDGGVVDFDTAYYRAEMNAAFHRFGFQLGHEVLTSDGGLYGTQTPLATKHAFNGWADKFLSTPAAGLVDSWIGANSKLGIVAFNVSYHDFSPDFGPGDYGSEVDLVLSAKLTDNYSVGAKFADYQSSGFSQDTTKAWLWFEAKF